MKIICLIYLLIFCLASPVSAQIRDTNSSGRENFLAVEGGSIEARIDRLTPLPFLVEKLNSEWKLEMTGKAYWIGYNNIMYSIAAHKDEAIPLLMDFIKYRASTRGKEGAIYTLHLIGIESKIAGRYYEEFNNKKARNALLCLLSYDSLKVQVAELLSRDPWLSDIPVLMNHLRSNEINNWPIINLIRRYNIKDLPIGQEIPKAIYEYLIPNFHDADFGNCLIKSFETIRVKAADKVVIEESLFREKANGYMWYELYEPDLTVPRGKIRLGTFISRTTMVEYYYIGNKFQYYVEDGRVFFCSAKTSAFRILNWWDSKTSEEKSNFNIDFSLRRIRLR